MSSKVGSRSTIWRTMYELHNSIDIFGKFCNCFRCVRIWSLGPNFECNKVIFVNFGTAKYQLIQGAFLDKQENGENDGFTKMSVQS